MGSTTRNLGLAVTAVLFAVIYQTWLKEMLGVIGVGRIMQPIEDFPYNCRRVYHDRLEACEDFWLDEEDRVLYLACAGSVSRMNWNPTMGQLNASGRRPSELMALDIDSPGIDGLFGMRSIKPEGYVGATGDDTLDLLGFDVEKTDAGLRFWLVNLRPPVDANGIYLDAKKVGANVTIDVFDMKRRSDKMVHVKTVWDPAIWSPNKVAALGDGSFVVTNDASASVGFRKELDLLIGGGNVVYCPDSGSCHIATDTKMFFANGLVRGTDGLIYVPLSVGNGIHVMELQPNGTLRELEFINLGMPVDNLSVGGNGDIWAAGLPKVLQTIDAAKDPFNNAAPSTVWRITKTEEGYKKFKVLEDRDKKVLEQIATVVHDAKTGRLYVGGPSAPFLSVCEPW